MSVVNHGVVSIEDGKKADTEYTPARKVRVELHFDIPEGQDADTAIAQVSALADAHVKRLLSGQAANPTTGTAAPLTTTSSASTSTPVTEKTTRQAGARKPKPVEVVLKPEPAADPAAVTDEPADDFSAPAAVAEVRPITDADLHSAAQKKNGEIKNPLAIRTLVSTFRPAGSNVAFQLAEIPQARRQEFLDKLAKLT